MTASAARCPLFTEGLVEHPHYTCRRCGREFCSALEGGADDLEAGSGFTGSDVCECCWDALSRLEQRPEVRP